MSRSLVHGSSGSMSADEPLGLAVTDFRQREPRDGTPVSRETTAYLSYDDHNLYVVFVCQDDPASVRASVARREDIGSDDAVMVYLDTFRDRQRAYLFMVNPRGVQLDGIRTEGQEEDLSFDAVWSSEGRLTDVGYVVRIEIPFRSLRFRRTPGQSWGVALGRIIRRNNEESYWPYITERVTGFVPQFGVVEGLSDISPGRNIQVTPYSTLARARILDDDVPGFRTLGDERIGLDAKMVVRDALTFDATVNPDFSQVETDDPQVTVNERFEVFFPEKRPFFIENAGYFQTPVNLLFSRRITDPAAGLRMTGKFGRWAVGAIGMDDRAPFEIDREDVEPGDPLADTRAWVGGLRVQREVGDESTVGVLATDRELEGSFNRIVSLDARLRFGDAWTFDGQLIRSDDRSLEGERLSGFGGLAQIERDGRHFTYTSRYLHFDPEFMAPLGFVPRVGIRQTEHEAEYQWRPEEGAVVSVGPAVTLLYNWDHSGVLLDREVGAQFQVELVGETEIEVEHERVFELFEELPFNPYSTQVSLSTEWLRWLALDASYEWGTAVNHDPSDGLAPFLGRTSEAEVQFTVRPTPALRWDQAYIVAGLDTEEGAGVFRERLLRTKVNYQFNRFLSLRAIVDNEGEDADPLFFDEDEREREWAFDVLLTYLLRPGTALYVGYTDKYENMALVPGTPPTVETTRSARTSTARQLFIKVSYLFQF